MLHRTSLALSDSGCLLLPWLELVIAANGYHWK